MTDDGLTFDVFLDGKPLDVDAEVHLTTRDDEPEPEVDPPTDPHSVPKFSLAQAPDPRTPMRPLDGAKLA